MSLWLAGPLITWFTASRASFRNLSFLHLHGRSGQDVMKPQVQSPRECLQMLIIRGLVTVRTWSRLLVTRTLNRTMCSEGKSDVFL